jgi:hypothetical protein
MAGRPRTRARVREAELATLEPVLAADKASMRIVHPASRHEQLQSSGMATMRDCVELARHETVNNFRTLVEIRDDEHSPAMVRLAAAGLMLDRAYGKAHQSIAIADVSGPGKLDLSAFSPDELRDFERLLTKATSDQPPTRDITPPKESRGVVPETD